MLPIVPELLPCSRPLPFPSWMGCSKKQPPRSCSAPPAQVGPQNQTPNPSSPSPPRSATRERREDQLSAVGEGAELQQSLFADFQMPLFPRWIAGNAIREARCFS